MQLSCLRLSRLGIFMVSTAVLGLPVAVWAVVTTGPMPRGEHLAMVAILSVGVVLGELLPVEIARNGRRSDEITLSTALVLALVLVAPLGWAVIAQSVPLIVDDIRRGKHWGRPIFNVAQYALTFASAQVTFIALSGHRPRGWQDLTHEQLPAAFAAAGVFFVVNQLLVGTAVAMFTREGLLGQLREDGLFQLATSGLLVSLAPVIIVLIQFSLILAPVLFLPLVAVRSSARMAVQRQHDALHDALTGLPNRAFLRHELDRRLEDVQARDDPPTKSTAVLLLDLDHFKEINDTLGHPVGDRLIIEVATRLTEVASGCAPSGVDSWRSSGLEELTVARLGGDEFALIASLDGNMGLANEQIVSIVHVLTATLEQAIVLSDVRLAVQASIGIAVAPWHGVNMDELLARADVAMYAAKQQRLGWLVYDPSQDIHTPERLNLLSELRDGIDRAELVVAYQPKCDVRTGRVHSVEALVRWEHGLRGMLGPDHFIPAAESTGLITQLTLSVLDQAISRAAEWSKKGQRLPVAVNLSARLLTDTRLPGFVEAMLKEHDLPGELLTLEVTESTIMNDPTRAAANLSGLRRLGVGLAIDDYGTGYSSLTYLRQLEADELKIDKSFIRALATGSAAGDSDAVIVRSTIELGRSLGMTVVAEGVEDYTTWQLLAELGCNLVQGYVLTEPLPYPAIDVWLGEWSRRHEAQQTAGDRKPGDTASVLHGQVQSQDRRAEVEQGC